MFYNKIKHKSYIVALFLFATTAHHSMAQSVASIVEDSENRVFSPSTIILSQTSKAVPFVKDGITTYLPQIVKEMMPQAWTSDHVNPPNIEILEVAQSNELKEMKELSNKLGISIRNTQYLSLYREAADWLGTRYRWSGNTKKGTDCSGLTGRLLKNVYNKDVARSSYIIANELKEELQTEELLPGDLVFFATLRRKGISHVGVYLGEGQFIHASRKGVVVSSLDDKYYARTLKKAGRL